MTPSELGDALADRWVARAGVVPVALPDELSTREGAFRGQPVRLVARAWRSERIAWARLVRIDGAGLSIGNLLAVGHPSLGLSLLGIDLVGARPDEVVVASDLVPTREAPAASAPDAPTWAHGHFSDSARVVRVPPHRLGDELGALVDTVERHATEVRTAAPCDRPDAVDARQRAYLALHRTSDPGMRLMPTLFGSDWSARFLAELMFPDLPR